jgi:hypothetical protein
LDARIRKTFRSQANLPNERIKGKMFPCLGRNGIWVQHEEDSEDMFVIALQVPLRAAMIGQLQLNARPSQKKSGLKLLAEQAYETLAVIAAVLPQIQNAFGTGKNCCQRLDNPPADGDRFYLQRCFPKKDTAASYEFLTLRAVDATDATCEPLKFASVGATT